jgi:DNA helicase-4
LLEFGADRQTTVTNKIKVNKGLSKFRKETKNTFWDLLMKFVILILAFLTGWLFYQWYLKEKIKRREKKAETLRQLFASIYSQLPNYSSTISKFYSHTNDPKGNNNGYFTNYELNSWINSASLLYDEIKQIDLNSIGLESSYLEMIKQFQEYYVNGHIHRTNYNKEFINAELKKTSLFFNNIENRKLDEQQRTAIITDEDNNLVIAGAGSGKTTTIVGKVQYLIDRYKIPPGQILLISFTTKSAAELEKRINIKGVEVKTFHKFGKDVIAAVDQNQPSIFDENQNEELLKVFFKELLEDTSYLAKVTSYFENYLKPIKSQDEFQNQGEYIQYLKDQNFSTYKIKKDEVRTRTTYNL